MALKKVRNTNTNVSSNMGGTIQGGTNRPQINKTSLSNSLSRSKYKYTTYNENFPGLNEASYNKLEEAVDKMGLSGAEKQTAMNEWYRDNVKYLLNDQILEERGNQLNEQAFKAAELNNPQANAQLRMTEFSQALKKKYNLDATADDLDVFETFVKNLGPNGIELAGQYLSGENKKLWYDAGLETLGEKVADFGVGVLQSPGKWGYNMVGQRMDRLGHWGAEKILGHEIATDENTFNGREATDIRTPILGEERANSKATKAGEVVGDIATGIALTAPAGATLAPVLADSTALGAGLLGAGEGAIDTLLTHYGSQGNLDITPTEAALGMVSGAIGGEMTRYLANLPKNQADNIRKEAEGYINKSIKPNSKANMTKADIDKLTDDTLDVFKQLTKKNVNGEYELIQYTDDAGNIIRGKLPTNMQETVETFDNLKKIIFNQYDDILKNAGQNGARVDLNKVFDNLDDLTKDVAQGMGNANTVNIVDDFKNRLLQYSDDMGTISLENAQKVQQEYNNILKNFFKNTANTSDDVSRAGITAKVNKRMGDQIDDAIEKGAGTASASKEYRQLKHLYGQIKNIEKEMAKTIQQQLKSNGGLSSEVLDALSGGEFTQAIISLDVPKMAKAGVMKGINEFIKWSKSPDVNIRRLFELVDRYNNPSNIQQFTQNAGNAIRGGLQNLSPAAAQVAPVGISTSEAFNAQ